VPIAGKYRLIDVAISNAINSQLQRMYVLTQYNSVSLHRHIGRTYRFDAFSKGYVQILAAQQTPTVQTWFQGTADAVRQNLDSFGQLRGDHVLILSGDHMYRMDYRQLLRDHVENSADITIAVKPCSEKEIAGFGAAMVNESGRIVEFREKPSTPDERAGMEVAPSLLEAKGVPTGLPYIASMGVYIFRKEALVEALDNDLVDFGGDIIPAEISRRRVQAHFFKGYWRDIGTIRAFFDAHMDLVQPDPPFTFHDRAWPIYTRPRFLAASKIQGGSLTNVLLADGCRLQEATIRNSVIGLRSIIGDGVTIERSVIMGADYYERPDEAVEPLPSMPIGIGADSVIQGAIVDKNARIGRHVIIRTMPDRPDEDHENWVAKEGIVIVPKGAVIPDGTVI
jgi:glucose-1-phosphate adenylyltransferase